MNTRFVSTLEGTVSDNETGLMWAKETLPLMKWDEAVSHCTDKFRLGGYKSWRLPSIQEMFTIIDYEKCQPASHELFDSKSEFYWTITKAVAMPVPHNAWERNVGRHAWVVGFFRGVPSVSHCETRNFVRPVRCVKLL